MNILLELPIVINEFLTTNLVALFVIFFSSFLHYTYIVEFESIYKFFIIILISHSDYMNKAHIYLQLHAYMQAKNKGTQFPDHSSLFLHCQY